MKMTKERINNLRSFDPESISYYSGRDLKIANEKHAELVEAKHQIEKGNINLSGDKVDIVNDLVERANIMAKKINRAEEAEQQRMQGVVNSLESPSGNADVQIWESVSGRDKGRPIKVLSNRAKLKNVLDVQNKGNLNWRDYMRYRIAGYAQANSLSGFDDPGSGYQNVMSTTSDTSMVPEPLSAEIIDRARAKARIFQAGAQTVPMDSKTLTIARVTGDPTVAWKAENASHSASDVTTEPLTFTAKTLIASVKMSVELSEDSPNASQVIEDTLSNSLALELDRVGLVGSGSGAEPQGIFGGTDVQTVSMGTNGNALTNYDEFSDAYQKVLEENGMPNAAIFAPRTWGTLDKLKDTTNQPLQPPMSFRELEKYQTTQVPIDQAQGTASDASTAFVGDFTKLLVGVRTDLRMEVSRVASDSTNSAWEDLQVWVRAYLRSDIQFQHPKHFCNIIGITP